ncbi:MAG: hypothetical protein A3H69_00540 [Candidatus Sungbacteria bacterium RIFCSPLOWO2_02_FULL_47_9]|uniref:Uncharacterized protein n=1 Tax=Candidatus Sungbacteria bacterium RIFCSPHIGHO2_01_FULL_47_32 TaxID=1802264 RepID=A0A1G2K4K4_9BACT|nr:MAG: hypothetical protein UX72_C0025G0016 [Parcubacteria group bacterium GW2011_GWA2_47_10]OGZ93430.1 MAG: hypothetical protein A2633_01760 [Candidatus Sungbacteria bacterium RIFCSPHIGHO2_01_FULL_47_32]OGZ99821.1 MAG: hypothetical protein A3D57_01160 [Candidatus Sungbacteria bacterium RIFCSPHIGHO2_02_FULL_46_12]OHA05036.1 MAG: hypothetical protein A3A28_03825 [Candidatus Sungbacteria bacterium RIFCSPLOWO2_01_FULL_47_32]OHA11851.1 MAG: hypothetical protein A3H69_00540 [Candidatus Sungbacteria
MLGFVVGLIVIIIGAVSVPVLKTFNLPYFAVVTISFGLMFAGFGIQMWSMLKPYFALKREMKARKEAHEALLPELASLPPAEALKRLLQGPEK